MFHEITLIGHLGRTPETRYTPQGKEVTAFSVAANHAYKDSQGELVKRTTWFSVTVWGKMGLACSQYLSKGSLVFIRGRLMSTQDGSPRLWDDRQGNRRASFEVNAHEVKFLTPRKDGAGTGQAQVVEAEYDPANEWAPLDTQMDDPGQDDVPDDVSAFG